MIQRSRALVAAVLLHGVFLGCGQTSTAISSYSYAETGVAGLWNRGSTRTSITLLVGGIILIGIGACGAVGPRTACGEYRVGASLSTVILSAPVIEAMALFSRQAMQIAPSPAQMEIALLTPAVAAINLGM